MALNYRFAYGSQQMSLGLAGLLGDRITLGAPVRAIRQDDSAVEVLTDQGSFEARRAIVTVPVPLSSHIEFEPRLPGLREGLAHRMPMGSDIKVFATYDRPFWRDQGLSGWAVADCGPLSAVFDNTTPNGQAALLGLIGGKHGHRWGEHDRTERRDAVLSQLTKYFGPEAMEPTDFIDQDWRDEEWTRGCPAAYMSPAGWMSFGDALRRPVGRIHWAGSELAPVWCTWMDGAISSGEDTAREVLARLEGRDHALDRPQPALRADSTSRPGGDTAHGTTGSMALPRPIDVAWLVKVSAAVFIVFGLVLGLADRVWVELDILSYPGAGSSSQPWWVPLLLGAASLVFVHLHRLLTRRWPPRLEMGPWRLDPAFVIAFGGAVFLGSHLGAAFVGDDYPTQYLIALVVVWLIRLMTTDRSEGRTVFVVTYSLLVAVLGLVGEVAMVALDLMSYADDQLLGVPIWLPGVWLQAALLARAISIRWFDDH
jgi:hypothetical protein